MDRRTAQALGLLGGTVAPRYAGLPQPGPQFTDQTYSSGGLSRALATPYSQSGGVTRNPADAGSNPGEMDPLLASQMAMGGRGGYMRGASAFLGAGFNPWTQEMGGPEGSYSAPAGQDSQIDALFNTAQQLGIDTSKYSRDANPVGIRGERSGAMDSLQLWDDLNNLAKDYVAVDHMTDDGKNSERTLYLDQNGQLVPVSNPRTRSARQDSAFFDDEFKNMLMTIGPAVVGGFMAAPAAGAGQAAGSAGGTAAATGASGQIPWGQIGTRALRGALTGGLTSGLQGGNILQGALMGGLSGGVSGAGIPAGVLGIGKNVLSGVLGMEGGGGSAGVGGSGGGSVGGGVAPVSGASALAGALGGGSSTGGGDSQFFNPDDARQRYLLNALRLNRSAKAGDLRQDRASALQKVLEDLG